MKKYRKKPVVIEALQFSGDANASEVLKFAKEANAIIVYNNEEPEVRISTLEGIMAGRIGDYIIKGVNGEFYPCKPDIFEKTYVALED